MGSDGKAIRDDLHRKDWDGSSCGLVRLRLLSNCSSVPLGGVIIGQKNKVTFESKLTCWIGYKFHIDAIDTGLPVSCILSSASVHDGQVAIPLADMTAQRITYLYECMDSAYDAAQIHDHSKKHGRVSIIDTNPRRNKDLKESRARERKVADRAGFIHPTDQPKFSSWSKTELWQVVDVEPMPVFGKIVTTQVVNHGYFQMFKS